MGGSRLWQWLPPAWTALLSAAGLAAVVTESRASAWILVAAVTLLFVARLATGIVSYRRTMSRPWPHVAPLPDDDDW